MKLNIISKFKRKKILVIGDVMLDRFLYGKIYRKSPEVDVPVVDIYKEIITVGGAANVAMNTSSLGASVFLTGAIGEDNDGEKIISILKSKGIDIRGLIIDKSRPTTVKTRIIGNKKNIVRVDKESRKLIDRDITRKLLKYIKNVVPQIDAVVISDYDKGVLSQKFLKEIIKLSKRFNKIVIANPKIKNFFNYTGVTVICINKSSAYSAFGKKSMSRIGKNTIKRMKCDAVLITQDKKGMALFEKNGHITNISPVKCKVLDVVGAGDTVVSVLALALVSGASMIDAVNLSNIAASIVVSKPRTAIVKTNELIGSINNLFYSR